MPALPLALPWAVSPTADPDLTATASGLCLHLGVGYGPLAQEMEGDWSWRPTLVEFRGVMAFAWGRMPEAGERPSPSERYGRGQIPFEDDETSCGPGRERYRERWLRTGMAPDSGIYQVRGAEWLWTVEADRQRFHHFVVEGHDHYVEVLAASVYWKDDSEVGDWTQCVLPA